MHRYDPVPRWIVSAGWQVNLKHALFGVGLHSFSQYDTLVRSCHSQFQGDRIGHFTIGCPNRASDVDGLARAVHSPICI